MPLKPANVNQQHANLLDCIARFLEDKPIILDMVFQDLTKGRTRLICYHPETFDGGVHEFSVMRKSKTIRTFHESWRIF
jgi:hypothetical protein